MSAITASASSPAASACSRIRSFTSSSETSMPAFSATASSASSRATDCAASARICAVRTSGVCPVTWKYASGRDPRLASERTNPFRSSRARVSTSGPARLHVRRGDERVDGGRPERGVDLLVERRRGSGPRCRRGARRACRTRSPSGRARRRPSGSTFSLTCLTVTSTVVSRRRRARSGPPASRRRARRRAPARSPRRGGREPSSTTVSDCAVAVLAGEIDDECVALARRAVVGGHELGDRAGGARRAPAGRAPRGPPPRHAAPRASSSRRSRGSAAPRPWR